MAEGIGMALFALLFVRDYAVFHPWKDTMFHFYTLIEVNCNFWNLIAQPTYCKNKTLDTYRDLQSVIESGGVSSLLLPLLSLSGIDVNGSKRLSPIVHETMVSSAR